MNDCFCRENIRGQLTGAGGPEQQPGQQLTVTRRHFETAFQSLRKALPYYHSLLFVITVLRILKKG
jgi:hypothetical protein